MDIGKRIEQSLGTLLAQAATPECPPGLLNAVRHSVFPAGARVRPRLCHAVARACGEDDPAATDAAASAVELLHCASLVHDDLPCFDDASTRRGQPSVHAAFGECLAILAGDALIVLAFQALAVAGARHPQRLPALLTTMGRAVGMPGGIVAGQAWECETHVVLSDYQRAKTGALFAAATAAGAATAGHDPQRLARARRMARRGLPGGRRHPRRRRPLRGDRQAHRARCRSRPSQCGARIRRRRRAASAALSDQQRARRDPALRRDRATCAS